MRKTRSDSKLLNLPEEQQAQLADWLLGGMPYHEAKAIVAKPAPEGFGVSVSINAFSGFWQTVCAPMMLQRRSRAVRTADLIAEEIDKAPGRLDSATIDLLKQQAFELASSPQARPRDVKALFSLVLKARDQELVERRIRLLETKAAQADQAEQVVRNEVLSPEEKAQRFKEIFGIA